jgi:hypothetical protein
VEAYEAGTLEARKLIDGMTWGDGIGGFSLIPGGNGRYSGFNMTFVAVASISIIQAQQGQRVELRAG